jgi:chromosome segregation ATPase
MKEKTDEPDSALEDKNETVTSEKVESTKNEDSLHLQSQLDSANETIDTFKAKLEEALAQVAELTKNNQALEKALEEERAKKPVVEEYEEGPGPQVGGEASAESIKVPSLEVESLKQKIESLTVENEYLSDKVFSLENKVANLVSKQRASLEFVRDSPDHFNKEPLSPNSEHSKPQRESPEIQSEIEKLMDRWKGWQVDMRGWRSLGIGPTFEI